MLSKVSFKFEEHCHDLKSPPPSIPRAPRALECLKAISRNDNYTSPDDVRRDDSCWGMGLASFFTAAAAEEEEAMTCQSS